MKRLTSRYSMRAYRGAKIRFRDFLGLTAALCAFAFSGVTAAAQTDPNASRSAAPTASSGAISPTRPQQQVLARLIVVDPDARELFALQQRAAREALAEKPQPIARIQTEGKLSRDPLRIATQQSLHDMARIGALGWAAAVTGNPSSSTNPYAKKAKEDVLAWVNTNVSEGDPIDDTQLEPLFVTYDLIRDTFRPKERERVEEWLRLIVTQEQRTGRGTRTTTRNNWNSHRLKVIGLIAFLLRDQPLIASVVEGYRQQVAVDLDPDGSSFDFHERDALHYHLYTLQPLLTLALAARRNGIDLYDYQGPSGASLSKSVRFVVPYCDGTTTHAEFVGSQVAFDRARAAAGDPQFKAGRLFDPREALPTLALAAAFDPQYGALERTVSGRKSSRFVSWQDVLNAAGGSRSAVPQTAGRP